MWALYYKLNADTHRQWIPAHAGDSLGSGFKTLYFLTPAPRLTLEAAGLWCGLLKQLSAHHLWIAY